MSILPSCAIAQTLSTTDARDTYQVGETVSIRYEGAQAGDRIIIYHDLSILPLAEALDVQQEEGVFDVAPVLQPGHYTALLARGSNALARLDFRLADLPIEAPRRIMVLSDIHVMSPDLVVDPESEAFKKMVASDRKLCKYSYEIFQAYCDTIRAIRPDLVLIAGDLTKEGELLSHQAVAAGLQQLLDEGIPTLVVPGNHDIECKMGRVYDYDGSHAAENITIEQFAEIYHNFGYDGTTERDPNSLSYACEPFPGLVLICIDDSRTPSKGDVGRGEAEYGRIIQPTLDWIVQKADEAVAQKKRVLAMVHHQMLEQFNGQTSFFPSAVTEHGDSIARIFAAHGIKAVLTGHMHIPNVAKIWSVDRQLDDVLPGTDVDSIYDISSASPISYPSQYRMLLFDEGLTKMDVVTRMVYSTATLENLQLTARTQIGATLPESVRTLTISYRATLDKMLQQFSGIPEFDNAIADIPEDNDELAAIAYEAFGPTLSKVVYTSAEGNEQLKGAADEILEQLKTDCAKACQLIFDNQNEDTRAFLTTIFQLMVMEKAEPAVRSMMSDVSFLGTPDENQTDDLYLTVRLTEEQSGIPAVTGVEEAGRTMVYTITGMPITGDASTLPQGIYVVRQGNSVRKILVK
ncbi:MAG: metallophosphoesterase [Prevotella sp.]|nr:metallophosphoesterase [Prevotella sp.]